MTIDLHAVCQNNAVPRAQRSENSAQDEAGAQSLVFYRRRRSLAPSWYTAVVAGSTTIYCIKEEWGQNFVSYLPVLNLFAINSVDEEIDITVGGTADFSPKLEREASNEIPVGASLPTRRLCIIIEEAFAEGRYEYYF